MDYTSIKPAFEKWVILEWHIHKICEENRITCHEKFGQAWIILKIAGKATNGRL